MSTTKLRPERVYVTTEADADPLSRKRIDAMLGSFDAGSVEVVTEQQLNDLTPDTDWQSTPRWGAQPESEQRDPDVVFTTGKYLSAEDQAGRREAFPNLGVRDCYGHQTFLYRPDGEEQWRVRTKGIVCQPAWQLHTIMGCPFRCAYCPLGGMIRILTDIEEYCEQLRTWTQTAPEQRLYKWDNMSDVVFFEPEYDATRLLVDFFANEPDRYLEIYAGKSDNVDFMLDYDHRGHTILQWSIAGRTQASLLEPRTAGMAERVEAARKCQEAGYLVRYRLSPIIPVAGWREDSRELFETIFERTAPDVITLCSFGWMDVEDARSCIDFGALDPEMVAAMEGSAPFLRERGYTIGGGRPLPHDARYAIFKFLIDEIRRINPDQVIALCLETEEMWRALEAELRQGPHNYVCNCGAMCTPGWPKYDRLVATP